MIRSAKIANASVLTALSFESKEYFLKWSDELTIIPEYIQKNDVFVFQGNSEVVGYYAVVELEKDIEQSGIKIEEGFWPEHMFLSPAYIGQGIDTNLFNHLRQWCEMKEIPDLKYWQILIPEDFMKKWDAGITVNTLQLLQGEPRLYCP